jgi:hypothetical protein
MFVYLFLFCDEVYIFGLIQKCTKKITPMKKQPDDFLRSTEISQTPPKAFGVRHEKFQAFRFGNHPGGCFFKGGRGFLSFIGRISHL